MRSERRPFSAIVTLSFALPASISPSARSAEESLPLASSLRPATSARAAKRSRSSCDSMIWCREKRPSSVSLKVSARSSSSFATSRSRPSERSFFVPSAFAFSIFARAAVRSACAVRGLLLRVVGVELDDRVALLQERPVLGQEGHLLRPARLQGDDDGRRLHRLQGAASPRPRARSGRASPRTSPPRRARSSGRGRRRGGARSRQRSQRRPASAGRRAPGRAAVLTRPLPSGAPGCPSRGSGEVHRADPVALGEARDDLDLRAVAAAELHLHLAPAEGAPRPDDRPVVAQEDRVARDEEHARDAPGLDLAAEAHGGAHEGGVRLLERDLHPVALERRAPGALRARCGRCARPCPSRRSPSGPRAAP